MDEMLFSWHVALFISDFFFKILFVDKDHREVYGKG